VQGAALTCVQLSNSRNKQLMFVCQSFRVAALLLRDLRASSAYQAANHHSDVHVCWFYCRLMTSVSAHSRFAFGCERHVAGC
jgi:hypothetical protein